MFKSHPFDDGRERLGQAIAVSSAAAGVAERVLFLDGAPGLADLLDGAKSVVTVNSTGAQQALCRGLPVAALGRSIYARPELVSPQPLAEFFAAPRPPDRDAYGRFRRFLLETSQIEGSFYSRAGIDALCAALPGAMLATADPYQRLIQAAPAPSGATTPNGAEALWAPRRIAV